MKNLGNQGLKSCDKDLHASLKTQIPSLKLILFISATFKVLDKCSDVSEVLCSICSRPISRVSTHSCDNVKFSITLPRFPSDFNIYNLHNKCFSVKQCVCARAFQGGGGKEES